MKKRLYLNNKIEVRKSLYGYGVFAKEKIEKDEILEECFYLVQPYTNPYNVNYLYRWPQKGKPIHMVIALGFGSIYNSSKTLDERNAEWITDKENNELKSIKTSIKTSIEDVVIIEDKPKKESPYTSLQFRELGSEADPEKTAMVEPIAKAVIDDYEMRYEISEKDRIKQQEFNEMMTKAIEKLSLGKLGKPMVESTSI